MTLVDQLFINTCKKLNFDHNEILNELKNEYINRCIIKYMFKLSDEPEKNAIIAGAIAMRNLYNNSPLTVREYYNTFKDYFRPDVAEYFDKYAEKLQQYILYENDFNLTYTTVGTFIETYLSRLNYASEPLEIPQFLWLRISVACFCNRKNVSEDEKFDLIIKLYKRLSNRQCITSSPIIFNMGFNRNSPVACMIYTIDDSMDDILDVMKEIGMATKNNAGNGVDLSHLRHSAINRDGESKGVVPLILILDAMMNYIDQGGKRFGALTASIKIHHFDVPEVIKLLDKVSERSKMVSKIHVSVVLNDLFMKRCVEKKEWTLFCPKQTYKLNTLYGKEFEDQYVEYEQKAELWKKYQKYVAMKKIKSLNGKIEEVLYNEYENLFKDNIPEQIDSRKISAESLLDEICDIQMKSGVLFIIHGDNVNRKNNMDNVGMVDSANLCQEIMIPAVARKETGCCNLSSISLKAFAHKKGFNFIEFGETVRDLVVTLNQVIDNSLNLSEKALRSNLNHRPIGIGVSGFADMLNILDLSITDSTKLPKKVNNKYIYVDYRTEKPDYDEASLKERHLNPKVEELNWKIWSCMYYNALLSSMEEAKKYGPYSSFWTSHTAKGELQYHLWQKEEQLTGRKYPYKLYPAEPKEWGQSGSWEQLISDIKKYGLRNSLLLTCMPTASTSLLIGNSEGIEFYMQNIFTRKVLSGDYPIINFNMVNDLKEINMWNVKTYNNIVKNNGSLLNLPEDGLTEGQKIRLRYIKEKCLTEWEIMQKFKIDLAGQRQVFICHSQSLNIYYKEPSLEKLKMTHFYTWKRGLKTGMYYLRMRSTNDPIKIGLNENVKEYKKSNIIEYIDKDEEMINETARKIQEEKERNDKIVRESFIDKILTDSLKPETCKFNKKGQCISCQ